MLKSVTKIFNDTIDETINKETSFRDNFSFEKRLGESTKILSKYPNRIPVIVERANKSIKQIDRKKYLVPQDLTIGQFIYVIRQRMKLESHESIYVFANGNLPPTSMLMAEIYNKNKDDDKFLYITYCAESTFG